MPHKVNIYIYVEYHSTYMSLRRTWESPHPLPRQRVFPSPQNQRGGGHTRLRVWGWGSPNSDDWRKSLALCLLCGLSHSPKELSREALANSGNNLQNLNQKIEIRGSVRRFSDLKKYSAISLLIISPTILSGFNLIKKRFCPQGSRYKLFLRRYSVHRSVVYKFHMSYVFLQTLRAKSHGKAPSYLKRL
jgi:hypothetical protein